LHFPFMNPFGKYLLTLMLFVFPAGAIAQKVQFRLKNQVSLWSAFNHTTQNNYQLGARYIPTLSVSDSLKKGHLLDAEFAADTYGDLMFTGSRYDSAGAGISAYRFWVRYSGPRFEIRLGLQKINFGSAAMLRPMMWFDRIDFRDPLQLTDGVYGALGRYYFRGNANIWIWVLYGEKKIKGWEIVPSLNKSAEYGGRIQIPVPKGEMGLSFHHREADFSSFYLYVPHTGATHYPENRIGLDGKWDIGPGIWYEYVVKHNDPDNGVLGEWETYFNTGIDYTFNIGNGVSLTTEFFRYNNKITWKGESNDNNFSALTMNYPFAIVNRITGVVYYNWTQEEWYRFINLERIYDYWSFYLMLFWNPERFYLYGTSNDRNLMSGKGIQLMAVVNF
jgi:hypothetical protein